jgi:hypothetical protein
VEEIRKHAWLLSKDVLGQQAIEDVLVEELLPNDPAVVALILKSNAKRGSNISSDGQHPFAKQQQRRPRH